MNIVKISEYDFPMAELDTDINETTIETTDDESDLPAFFDVRLKWGNICEALSRIGNQGRCKSGWVSAKLKEIIIISIIPVAKIVNYINNTYQIFHK